MVLISTALCSMLGQCMACLDVVCISVIMLLTDKCSTSVARTAARAIKQWCTFLRQAAAGHKALKAYHNISAENWFMQAAVMGGARGGPAGQPGQQDGADGAVELGWEEVLDQLPQEAAAELRNAGHGKLHTWA